MSHMRNRLSNNHSFFSIFYELKKTCCTSALSAYVLVPRGVRAFGVSFVNDGFAKVLRRETLVCYAFDSLLV